VLTAMKMEHKLTAGIAGVVESVGVAEGATVEQGATLAVVSPHHSPAAAAPV
jgi:biotin carboxyl carrier protein